MLRRLRALLAHARAGHRIGCETCAQWKGRTEEYRKYLNEIVAPAHEHFWSQPVDTAGTRECIWCGAIDTRPYREADHLPSTYDGPLRELREDGRL